MLPEARRRAILRHLAQVGSDTIIDLGKRFHKSTMTIRRDLKTLQEAGFVTMSHGGAIYNGDSFQQHETHQIERATIRAAEKRAIGQYAAEKFVDAGDVLFLDSGTTVRAMVPCLKGKANLSIASNSIRTIDALHRHLPDSTILSTGGLLSATAQTFVGPVAERFFEDFFARKAFISGVGFTIAAGLADSQMLDTAVKKSMTRSAETTIVVIDSSKIGHTAMVQVMQTREIQALVTDEGIADADRQAILDCGIDLHIAPVKPPEARRG
ncbi:MAG: DeoR/GlpR family DNA-binding transcription regulator [Chloroflexota bacterium]|nr:DeoR/GlpR family DNA-binding transcription regulator [Chloroflexota bacterium]